MKKNIIISLALGAILSTLTLYLAFRNVPFIDLVSYLTSINYLWIIPAILFSLFTFVLRVIRWQIILAAVHKIDFWRAFHPLMIGFMINCILPGRVGEVARPLILKKNDDVPFSTGLATVATERVFDVSFIVMAFAAVLTFVRIDPGFDITFGGYHLNRGTLEAISGGMLTLCLVMIFGIVVISIETSRRVIINSILGIPALFFFISPSSKQKIREKVLAPLVKVVENFAAGFSLVKYPKKILGCLGLSFMIWSLQAFSYYIMSFGCPGIGLSYFELFTVMIIICFFIALPSVPGFWGLWEAGGVFALTLFGVSSKDAAGFTLANHAVQMFPVIIVGLISAVITGVNIWQVSYGKKVSV